MPRHMALHHKTGGVIDQGSYINFTDTAAMVSLAASLFLGFTAADTLAK